METDYFLILGVSVRDKYKPWGAIRPLEFYGQIPKRDIGHRVKEEWEEVYGLFRTEDDFKGYLKYMIDVHGDLVDETNSQLAQEPGLQLDPPLLLESIACSGVIYKEYKVCIDMKLRRGIIDEKVQDDWTELVYKLLGKRRILSARCRQPHGYY